MKKLTRKDILNRNSVSSLETKRFVLKNMSKNGNLSLILKFQATTTLLKILKRSSFTFFTNRCVFTGRKKRINKLYSFSRIAFLKYARFGFINGLKKSSW